MSNTVAVDTKLGKVRVIMPKAIGTRVRAAIKQRIKEEIDDVDPVEDLQKELRRLDPDIGLPKVTLRTYLDIKQWTQTELGKKAKIPQPHISEMIRGKREIGLKYAKKLGHAFGIDYRRFL